MNTNTNGNFKCSHLFIRVKNAINKQAKTEHTPSIALHFRAWRTSLSTNNDKLLEFFIKENFNDPETLLNLEKYLNFNDELQIQQMFK